PGRPRSVTKYVAQVAAAVGAVHFCARHEIAPVFARLDRMLERLPKAGPAGSAFKFGGRGEERLATACTVEPALALVDVERAGARPFGTVLAQDMKLTRRQRLFPFLGGLVHGKGFAFHKASLLQASANRSWSRATTLDGASAE